MKKVIFNNRKLKWNDLWRTIIIFLIHLFGFFSYFFIVLGFNFAYRNLFFPNSSFSWIIFIIYPLKFSTIYPLTFGIIINVGLHIIYSELGNPWIRLIMWIHSGIIAILISLIVFLS